MCDNYTLPKQQQSNLEKKRNSSDQTNKAKLQTELSTIKPNEADMTELIQAPSHYPPLPNVCQGYVQTPAVWLQVSQDI